MHITIMRRGLAGAVFLCFTVLTGIPAAAASTSQVACASDDGRERLTLGGRTYEFEAPVAGNPDNSMMLPRFANFLLKADLAPAAAAAFDVDLEWEDPSSDFDLYILDSNGALIASSSDYNYDDPSEQVSAYLAHCEDIRVVVRNYAATPLPSLTLTVTKTATFGTLACIEDDPAPGCAAKAAGQAPEAVPDTRTRLWLGGDRPGQTAMLHGSAATGDLPARSGLVTSRPTSGTPNTYTRAALGDYTLERNVLMPFYTISFAEPRDIVGSVKATFWVSSSTLSQGGTLYAQIWADGSLASQVAIPGTEVASDVCQHPFVPCGFKELPTMLHRSFDDLDLRGVERLTFQIGSDNPVGSNGPRNLADTTFTVHYDSVQYPAGLTLP